MGEALNRYLAHLLALGVFMLVIIYAFFCMVLGPHKAGKAVGAMFGGVGKAGMWVVVKVLRISVMFVINFITMIIRMAGQPSHAADAWATFIERMTDAIIH